MKLTDHELAEHLASETGKRLISLRQQLFNEDASPWYVMDAGDALAHRFLVDSLSEFRPNDAVLSEEGADSQLRQSSDRVWIIDPLDGSNEYGEFGRADWAVHVALWQRTNISRGRTYSWGGCTPRIRPHSEYCTSACHAKATRGKPASRCIPKPHLARGRDGGSSTWLRCGQTWLGGC